LKEGVSVILAMLMDLFMIVIKSLIPLTQGQASPEEFAAECAYSCDYAVTPAPVAITR
jgi:hypothetical protein